MIAVRPNTASRMEAVTRFLTALPPAAAPILALARFAGLLMLLYFLSTLTVICSVGAVRRRAGLLGRLEGYTQYAVWRLEHDGNVT